MKGKARHCGRLRDGWLDVRGEQVGRKVRPRGSLAVRELCGRRARVENQVTHFW